MMKRNGYFIFQMIIDGGGTICIFHSGYGLNVVVMVTSLSDNYYKQLIVAENLGLTKSSDYHRQKSLA